LHTPFISSSPRRGMRVTSFLWLSQTLMPQRPMRGRPPDGRIRRPRQLGDEFVAEAFELRIAARSNHGADEQGAAHALATAADEALAARRHRELHHLGDCPRINPKLSLSVVAAQEQYEHPQYGFYQNPPPCSSLDDCDRWAFDKSGTPGRMGFWLQGKHIGAFRPRPFGLKSSCLLLCSFSQRRPPA